MDKPFAITLDVRTSLANHTGSWRSERPVYVDALPPCNHACPAGEDIQQWLYAAEDGSYETAWRELVINNPFPAVMGRVCYHPCETACNRAELDTAVGINSVERFLGDEAIPQGWRLPTRAGETGKRGLVVGAGPAGLSPAIHRRRLGTPSRHPADSRHTAGRVAARDVEGGLLVLSGRPSTPPPPWRDYAVSTTDRAALPTALRRVGGARSASGLSVRSCQTLDAFKR